MRHSVYFLIMMAPSTIRFLDDRLELTSSAASGAIASLPCSRSRWSLGDVAYTLSMSRRMIDLEFPLVCHRNGQYARHCRKLEIEGNCSLTPFENSIARPYT